MTPGAVLTIAFGLWLWLGWFRPRSAGCTRRSRWSRCSSAITSGAGGCCATSPPSATRSSHVWFRWFNEVPDARAVRHGVPGCLQAVLNAFFATAPRGLEALARRRSLPSLGAQNAVQVPGGVAFGGDLGSLLSREPLVAHRFAHPVAGGRVPVPSQRAGPLRRGASDRLAEVLCGRAHDARQRHGAEEPAEEPRVRHAAVKDAVCDRFRDKRRQPAGRRPRAPDVRIHAFLEEAKGTLYLDTSGEPLFKRGWRMDTARRRCARTWRPASSCSSGWKPDQPLLDPMCGGGTLLVEAAAMARGRAPGAKRSFGFEKLALFDSRCGSGSRARGPRTAARAASSSAATTIREALQAARRNLGRRGRRALGEARAGRRARARRARSRRRHGGQPALRRAHRQPGGARAFYPKLGDALKKRFAGWNCYLLHRRPAPAEADPPEALAPHAAVERRARVPALRVPDRRRSSHAGFPPVTRGPYAYLRRGTRVPGACTGGPQLWPSLRIRLSASNGALTFTSLSKYT